jgi:hypothetical protein
VSSVPKVNWASRALASMTIPKRSGLRGQTFRDSTNDSLNDARADAQLPADLEDSIPIGPQLLVPPASQPVALAPSDPFASPRVALYEEDRADAHGKHYVGPRSGALRLTPGPGAPADLAARADLEIPKRRITMTFSLRRNSDKALPASHTIEVKFNLPAYFPFGGTGNVPEFLMKEAEGSACCSAAIRGRERGTRVRGDPFREHRQRLEPHGSPRTS